MVPLNDCGAKTVTIFDGDAEAFHDGAGVLAETLLAGNKRVAMVGVLHCTLLQVGRNADVVVRADDEAGAFALEELSNGFDFFRRGFLLRDHVIETEDHQRVGVSENALVDGQSLACLIDALEDCDGMCL